MANGGTLFLDEIGYAAGTAASASPGIKEGKVMRIGANRYARGFQINYRHHNDLLHLVEKATSQGPVLPLEGTNY